jgi:Family of unknown function (DUF6599)
MRTSLLIALALLFVACQNTPDTPQPKDAIELIPADNEISGWTAAGPLQVCASAAELLALIDGEGQTYIDNGFVKSAFKSYSGTISGPVTLDLRVFDMGDTTHARMVYAAVASGQETPWTGDNPGNEARIESQMFSHKVEFWDDKFFFWTSIADPTDPALEVARLFARNVGAAIRDTTD